MNESLIKEALEGIPNIKNYSFFLDDINTIKCYTSLKFPKDFDDSYPKHGELPNSILLGNGKRIVICYPPPNIFESNIKELLREYIQDTSENIRFALNFRGLSSYVYSGPSLGLPLPPIDNHDESYKYGRWMTKTELEDFRKENDREAEIDERWILCKYMSINLSFCVGEKND